MIAHVFFHVLAADSFSEWQTTIVASISNTNPGIVRSRSQLIAEVAASVQRWLEPMRSRDPWSWAAAAWVVVIAAVLRFVKLGFPPSLVFDELYYANGGQQLLDHGVEWRYFTDEAGRSRGRALPADERRLYGTSDDWWKRMLLGDRWA